MSLSKSKRCIRVLYPFLRDSLTHIFSQQESIEQHLDRLASGKKF
jgi:hypothetical protein